jgi:hypothetical protein
VGINLFDSSALAALTCAFAKWAEVISVEHEQVTLDLHPSGESVRRIRVEFQTPTDLKAKGDSAACDFPILLARARDRISTLRGLYGAGPLTIDFRGLAERAKVVKVLRSELRRLAVDRRSSRNGQRHSVGGWVGFAEYEGDLAEFMPYLEAASWTGVGRHCSWGNGHITTKITA